ncbi:TPA: restriction endonuclease subunit S [Acinetobacter baumannii]|uniref:restriction endonuclease subunit S n=1 Tax=Acinetobacter baumannii TaxID=470 RepID=UPI000448CEBC|nr:restriction endonuclease subunit S [Acinetobacter baumannii]EXC16473.1 type I restriction modification DNA specificity domain protein [Acinetobacter baumannii 4749]MCZ2977669.1 restriction endonuclease subunit S [Acinetobacter baumannii]MDQ8912092.1 restriction endonuclease subunit S [Acinetobacter baumannii]HAV4964411.1 restriction endonuclease subunit S [Acinetobacter baumannii]
MSEIITYRLDEIADVIDCEHKTAPKVDSSDYYSIRTPDIKNGRLLYEQANRVSAETYELWTKRGIPEAGDIILAREAPVGEVGWIDKDHKICLGQRTVLIKIHSIEIDKKYLLYSFVSPKFKDYLNELSGGSVVAHLNMKDIRALEFSFPPLPEQKAIASVLSSLDDKIDLLHRQNKTLEVMAETLFRQWFIEDETLEEIPVSELIDFNPKRTLSKGTEATYLEMAGLSTQSFNATGYYKREFSSGTKFIKQDTLLARITPCLENGKAGYVTFLEDNEVGWGSTEYIVMRPKEGLHPLIAYILCRTLDFKDYAESCMEGSSGRQRVNVDHLKEYTIGKPSCEIVQKFNNYLTAIEAKLIYNSNQIQTLEKLRDTLLPKVMSGEVRVRWD